MTGSESLMGHSCSGPLIKKQKIEKDGTAETELYCLTKDETMFEDLECNTKTHKLEIVRSTLLDGTEVVVNKCTNY